MSYSHSVTMPSRRRAWIAVLCALVAIVASAGVTARAQAAVTGVTDWTAVSANTASGTLGATSVTLSGSHVWNTPTSVLDGSWPYFSGPAFSPALTKSDMIQISGAPGYSYTLHFSALVTNPILEVGSLGSRIDFATGTSVTKLSGESGFTVSQNSVSGTPSNTIGTSGNNDASGTIQLTGSYTAITFTTTPNYTGPEDGILVQLLTAGGSDTCQGADTPITQANLAAAEDTIVCLVNRERTAAGLAPLTVNATLRGVARAHSQDMVQRRFFSHVNPDGKSECDRITGAGYPAKCIYSTQYQKNVCWTDRCGENIAWFSPATPNRFMYDPQAGWMTHLGPDGTLATNEHRKAILNPNFKDIGVGVVLGNPQGGPSGGGATATQDFGSPA